MEKIIYGFYWDDEATETIQLYIDKLPMIKFAKFETKEFIPFKENEIINIQIEKFSGMTIEAAIKKIRKFVVIGTNSGNSDEANLHINIMLCFTDTYNKFKIQEFLDDHSKRYALTKSQRELFTQ